MRVVRNEGYIKKRTQWTQRGSLLGMGLLLVSLLLSTQNKVELTMISWLLLLVGFVVAMISVQVGNRYVRPPRADTVLDKMLKGLDGRFVAYHYFYPAEHLLLTPSGLIVIQMQGQKGSIAVRGRRYQQRSFGQQIKVLFGDSPLGNPVAELNRTMTATARIVNGLGSEMANLPLDGLVFFYADKVKLTVEDPEYDVVTAEEIKAKVREIADAYPALPSHDHKAIAAALAGQVPIEESAEPAEAAARPQSAAASGGKGKHSGKSKRG